MSLLKSANKYTADRASQVKRVENFDHIAIIRNNLRRMSEERGDYSGCPMPLDGQRLVIEPTFKYAGLDDIYDEPEVEADPVKIRNCFWSYRLKARIAICEWPEGKFWCAPMSGSSNAVTALLHTVGASDAWGIEQESKALELLSGMLRHRQMKQYLLTGGFLETSERSKITYLFRKLRPTVAIKNGEDGRPRILCTMCMHPIGYYEESWAGCMCPTDDLIAHLVMMRGDERFFWRKCNQHHPHDPASGI
jgi:hypothetical protein